VALAGLIMSHNIMAMLFSLALGIWLVYLWLRVKNRTPLVLSHILMIILGLGLAGFFWLPALYDKRFTLLDTVTVARFWEHFPTLNQLLVPGWGYGPSVAGADDAASYQIGLVHLFGALAAVAAAFKVRKNRDRLLIFGLILVFFILMMLSPSTFIWKLIPVLWRTQFPWRLLSVTAFITSLMAGSLLAMAPKSLKSWAGWGLIGLVILLNVSYARPETLINKDESFYTTNQATTTVQDEYMPVWVQKKPIQPAGDRAEIISGQGEIDNLSFNAKKTVFDIKAATPVEVQVNTVYFPGWQAKIDRQTTSILYRNEAGLMRLKVPEGDHRVKVKFQETPLRLGADIISLVSLLGVGYLLLVLKKKKP
jgi:uncharacterized membrane protein YfhO